MNDFEEAIQTVEKSRYGNAASIFTQNGCYARDFKYRVHAGNIGVNPFISLVISRFGSLAAANSTAATGADHVYVLNLFDSSGRNAQDQLIYTTAAIPDNIAAVPDGGTTAIMLGIGFTGATLLSRRLRRK